MEKAAPISKRTQTHNTLRFTFRITGQEVKLVSYEHLEMICPPSTGDLPQAGRNGGFWIELRDKRGKVLFHRVLDNPLGDSVEVHSPDGKIQREFGTPKESIFEVLVPEYNEAKIIVLLGESLEPVLTKKEKMAARELASFKVPENKK
jgi:hypothetical protein